MSVYSIFPPGKPLSWPNSAPGSSAASLLSRKEEVFALQRKLADEATQKRARKKGRKVIRARPNTITEYRAYFRFCDAAAIPPYPVTPILSALCILAKKAGGNPNCGNLERELRQLEDPSSKLFADDDGYQKLMQLSRELDLGASIRAGSNGSGNSSEASNGEESESDGSDDDDSDAHSKGSSRQGRRSAAPLAQGTPEPTFPTKQALRAHQASVLAAASLPKPGDTFSTMDEARCAVALATLSTHGIAARYQVKTTDTCKITCSRHGAYWATRGGRCDFQVVLFWDKLRSRWVVSGKDSIYEHNHGQAARRATDPQWLPLIKFPGLRRALGLKSLDGSQKRKRKSKKREATSDSEPASESSTSSSDEESEAESSGMETSPSSSLSVSTPKRKRRKPDSTATASPRTESVVVSSAVAAFCAGLHPSLHAFAQPLGAIGIDSVTALATLRLLESRSLSDLLKHMRAAWNERRLKDPSLPPLSVLHLQLFAKLIRM